MALICPICGYVHETDPEDDHPAAVSIEEFRAAPWYRRAWWLLWH